MESIVPEPDVTVQQHYSVPEVTCGGSTGRRMPVLGMGTASYPFAGSEGVKQAILHAINLGYRHFDTAALYQTEQSLGEAISEAFQLGLIKSRDELFITSKPWCSDAHSDLVLPALQNKLRKGSHTLRKIGGEMESIVPEPDVTVQQHYYVPEVTCGGSTGRRMPVLGMGTATYPFARSEGVKQALLQAIKLGYRHFDTAAVYQTEQYLGEAISEGLQLGLIKSRDELFITSKLWCSDAHSDLVLPALQNTLRNLQLEYLDLYLVHWPLSLKPGKYEYPVSEEDLLPMDFESVWSAMEECHRLGLTKSIGVSNFSCKKLENLLAVAKISPAVNQVEMNPLWQQKKLREFCKTKGIVITAYSPLGAKGTGWGSDRVMECEVLHKIAKAKGKSHAQICLRWVYEQGVSLVAKSFNENRMKENLEIFDWELNAEDLKKISEIPQGRGGHIESFLSPNGPFKSLEEFWDGEI